MVPKALQSAAKMILLVPVSKTDGRSGCLDNHVAFGLQGSNRKNCYTITGFYLHYNQHAPE